LRAPSTPPPSRPPITVDGHQLAVPTKAQAAWADLEVGMFIHLAPQTWQDHESDDLSTPLSSINPNKLDTDQWASVAQSMGAKYIVFVAKHEGGFCWWQTDTTDFSVKNTPWRNGKGDVLADLSKSCQKLGLKLGVYLSPQDKKHNIGVGGKANDPSQQATYEKLFRQQLTEVLTRYGDMCEVWFDGSLTFDVGDILQAHAKEAAIFQGPQATIRWAGNEDGFVFSSSNTVKSGAKTWGDYTANDSDVDGDRWLPIEADSRIRTTWFWQSNNQHTLQRLRVLVERYDQSVGYGANMLLNVAPDTSGLIPEGDATRAAAFGAEIKRRYTPVAETSGKGMELTLNLPAPTTIDRLVLMEDITQGERIRSFTFDVLVNDAWQYAGNGPLVGHKQIVAFTPVTASAVRLHVIQSVGEPFIRALAACSTGAKPPPAPRPLPAQEPRLPPRLVRRVRRRQARHHQVVPLRPRPAPRRHQRPRGRHP